MDDGELVSTCPSLTDGLQVCLSLYVELLLMKHSYQARVDGFLGESFYIFVKTVA